MMPQFTLMSHADIQTRSQGGHIGRRQTHNCCRDAEALAGVRPMPVYGCHDVRMMRNRCLVIVIVVLQAANKTEIGISRLRERLHNQDYVRSTCPAGTAHAHTRGAEVETDAAQCSMTSPGQPGRNLCELPTLLDIQV